MTDIFLITRPEHDDIVPYLSFWSEEILKFADERNIRHTDFKADKACKENVIEFLENMNPRLVIFNGHGSSNEIYGHKNEPLITSGVNEHLLKSKITYAIACDCAQELGIKIIESGDENTTFIGYNGPFSFVRDSTWECNPSKDKFSIPFKNISNVIILSLIKGSSAKEAYEKSQQLCSKLIEEYSTSDAFPEAKEIRFWLWWDKNFQRIYGNNDAKFV